MSEDDLDTADTMRGRADESRTKLWLLLEADRLVLTGVLAVVVFALFMLGTALDPGLARLLQRRSVIESLFSSMVIALVTGVTFVVTINQLVLSQESGPLSDQHERMSGAMDVRSRVGEVIGEPPPPEPADLLGALLAETESRAEALGEAAGGAGDPRLRDELDEFADDVAENARTTRRRLADETFGSFDVVSTALDFDYSWKIYQTERIEHEYDALGDAERRALEDLRESLVLYAPLRQHVKTLYFEWELVDLSRMILYLAIPAVVLSAMMVAYVGSATVPGATLGVSDVRWLVGIAFTVTLVPFLLLTVYVLRIATVSKRTAAIGPIVLRESP